MVNHTIAYVFDLRDPCGEVIEQILQQASAPIFSRHDVKVSGCLALLPPEQGSPSFLYKSRVSIAFQRDVLESAPTQAPGRLDLLRAQRTA